MKKQQPAFSLIELMVVMAIIAILAFMGVANFSSSIRRSRDAVRKSDLSNLQQALVLYRADTGTYPTENGETQSVLTVLADPNTQYIKTIPQPPLLENGGEKDYQYTCTQLVGSRCVQFSLCTGGLNDDSASAGLEFQGESNGNATSNTGEGYPTSNGRFFCVFNP
jgi:prepilin-type N-terminal cleavage/methylation domain-containing protein